MNNIIMEIPKNHQVVMPYLIMNGAEAFIAFTQKVFQADLITRQGDENEKRIRHAEIEIGGSTLMIADATAEWKSQGANLFIYVERADDVYHVALANGATNLVEPSDQSYGRTCGVADRFGNVWWTTSL